MPHINQNNEPLNKNKEGIVKSSLHSLTRSFVLMHKTQIKIWKAMLITVFVAGFASALILTASQNWFGKIKSAPGDVVTNQAFITYEDADGNNYSGQSNIVSVTEVAATTSQIRIRIELEEKTSDFSASNVALYIYQAGTASNPILQTTGAVSSNGELEINVGTLPNGSYDLRVIIPYHLSVSLKNFSFSGSDLDLRTTIIRPKAGNLQEADNVINSLDWSIMSAQWASADPAADINSDGMVNSLDWSLMNRNWLATGD